MTRLKQICLNRVNRLVVFGNKNHLFFESSVCSNFNPCAVVVFFIQKICGNLTEDNVIIDGTGFGLVCKVICPECNTPHTLSSSVNKTTGKSSFSIFNFNRHFKKHDKPNHDAEMSSPSGGIDYQKEYNDLKITHDAKGTQFFHRFV